MMQIPNLPNYPQAQQPSYNAVKIDIHNPMVNVPNQQPVQNPAPQYEAPTMPIYNYPQAPVQPYYMPPQVNVPEIAPQAPAQQPVVVPPVVEQKPQAPAAVEVKPEPVAKEIPLQPTVVPPAPVVTEAPAAKEVAIKESKPQPEVKEEAPVAEGKPVEIAEPEEIKPQVDLNEFIAKLTNSDYDVQAAAMESIADMVDQEPEKATELLDTKIVDALTNIITADTSALEGPSAEVQAQRQNISANAQLSDEEKAKALEETITPKEKAERNKSYAMFTAAIMQKLYGKEVQKLTNATVPLTELPGAVTIVEQLKGNPNPMVRTSAIESLSYIQDPSYKKDLETVFTIAQQDQDQNVRDAATAALQKLSQIADEVQMTPEQPKAEVQQAA